MRRKRFLWVLGVSPNNLGEMIADMAMRAGREDNSVPTYDEVLGTDETTGDVQSEVHLLTKVKQIHDKYPSHVLDVVYCAGVNRLAAIKEVDEGELYETFSVNVMGFIRLLGAITKLYDGKTVNVVAIASDAARNPMRNSINYCASKAALVQAVRVAARELAPYYRVNAVSPAIIHGTPMSLEIDVAVQHQRGWTHEQAMEYERSLIPMQRRAFKHEVAEVVLNTLLGPEFLTGSNIEITGGK